MKIFVDTNIFLDLILKRNSYEDAMMILNAVEKALFKGYILDITILNIDYVAKKQIKDIRDFLTLVTKIFIVDSVSNKDILNALDMKNSDLEDNLQYISAKKCDCEVIVTNDKNFCNLDIKVMSAKEFLKEYLNII